jgi:hypothetical protein
MDGRTILPIFQMKIDKSGENFVICWLKSSSSSGAGLRIKAVKVDIEVNGQHH